MFGIAAALWAALTPLLAGGIAALMGVEVAAGASVVTAIEATGLAGKILWTGASFGMFGGLYAAVNAVSEKLFGVEKSLQHESETKVIRKCDIGEQIENSQSPTMNFAQRIEQERWRTSHERVH